jgi:hypothetical protein
MFENMPVTIKFALIGSFLGLLSACAVTTGATDGTSETLQNTSDASTDFTSSTSPHKEAKEGGARQVQQFASVNFDRLREDIARGDGEHLRTFAHLLGIKENHQTEFFAVAKKNYSVLFTEPTTSGNLLARLNTELEPYPTWRQ